ncbi:hypothetical protein RRG08_056608 [Elysia crispata]|uniref:Uncharacterized protein n=1 Tax=Elysia crispata TaxID=231223 RepID=A0AAE1E9M1_9GAST|nr:hypothetical protein RRG08_056608 [Elysia crispata]
MRDDSQDARQCQPTTPCGSCNRPRLVTPALLDRVLCGLVEIHKDEEVISPMKSQSERMEPWAQRTSL